MSELLLGIWLGVTTTITIQYLFKCIEVKINIIRKKKGS